MVNYFNMEKILKEIPDDIIEKYSIKYSSSDYSIDYKNCYILICKPCKIIEERGIIYLKNKYMTIQLGMNTPMVLINVKQYKHLSLKWKQAHDKRIKKLLVKYFSKFLKT